MRPFLWFSNTVSYHNRGIQEDQRDSKRRNLLGIPKNEDFDQLCSKASAWYYPLSVVVKLVVVRYYSLLHFFYTLLVLQTCINPFRTSKQLNQSWEQHKSTKSSLMVTRRTALSVPFVLLLNQYGFEPMVKKKAKENHPMRRKHQKIIWMFAPKVFFVLFLSLILQYHLLPI